MQIQSRNTSNHINSRSNLPQHGARAMMLPTLSLVMLALSELRFLTSTSSTAVVHQRATGVHTDVQPAHYPNYAHGLLCDCCATVVQHCNR